MDAVKKTKHREDYLMRMFDKWKRQLPSGEWVRIKRRWFKNARCVFCGLWELAHCRNAGIPICNERGKHGYLRLCKPPKGRG